MKPSQHVKYWLSMVGQHCPVKFNAAHASFSAHKSLLLEGLSNTGVAVTGAFVGNDEGSTTGATDTVPIGMFVGTIDGGFEDSTNCCDGTCVGKVVVDGVNDGKTDRAIGELVGTVDGASVNVGEADPMFGEFVGTDDGTTVNDGNVDGITGEFDGTNVGVSETCDITRFAPKTCINATKQNDFMFDMFFASFDSLYN